MKRKVAILVLVLAAAGTAQMGPGRGGSNGMMGGSLGGMMGGSLWGMMGGGSGLAVGSDGTLYLVRSATTPQSSSSQTPSTQLAAIDGNGNAKWTLPINSISASQPAIGKDGMLFVTTSDWSSWMYDWMYSRSTPAPAAASSLLVVKPGTTSATLARTVPLVGQVASAPQVAVDSTGGYVVYVVTVDGFSGNGTSTGASSATYLYCFSSSGAQKYRLQLSQGGAGMMGF